MATPFLGITVNGHEVYTRKAIVEAPLELEIINFPKNNKNDLEGLECPEIRKPHNGRLP